MSLPATVYWYQTNEQGEIQDRISFPTEFPERTMNQVIEYFEDKQIESKGIGSFGPINIDAGSAEYGFVTTIPKVGWSGYPFLNTLKEVFDVPYGWDTDVNAAAFAEAKWGAAKGLDRPLWSTGTGYRSVDT
jgi:fructokinase